MPELPEVEVICRGLRPYVIGRRIEDINYNGKKLRIPVPIDLMHSHLIGPPVCKIMRRAKYLLFHFENNAVLIIHLGMTGNLGLFPIGSSMARHDHICWQLDDHTELRYNDTRRFGMIHLIPHCSPTHLEKTFFSKTGPEPLEDNCTAEYLQERARGKTLPIKSFLMNAEMIAGIGNIYANESLYKAGIKPSRQSGKLQKKDWILLLNKLRSTLHWAIDCGGSTISDFLNASGEKGYFQANFKIYGKEGQPCDDCSTLIEKTTIGGRASFHCPQCQKR